MLSNKRKVIIFTTATIMLVIGAMLLLYHNKIKNTKTKNVVHHFYQVSSYIPNKREYPVNSSVNPCTNFYEYACSNVINNFKLREDRSAHMFSYDDAEERLLDEKKQYLLKLENKNPESKMEGEIKNFYMACMNKSARQKEELTLVEKTKKTLAKIKTKKDFLNFIADNITDPLQLSFISFNAKVPNLDKPNYYDLFFDTQLMNLPERSYYSNQEIIQALNKLVQQFFISIGEKTIKQKANYVVSFEKELAQVYPSPLEFRKRIYSRTQISRETLIKDYPYLKLEKFLNTIPKHVVIRNIIGDQTMRFLNVKLKTASLEELKSIYLYFQLSPLIYDTYPEFFSEKNKFYSKYLGWPNQITSRQEFCTKNIMYNFEKEIDYILLPKLFPDFPKEKFVRLFKKVRDTLIKQLETNTWLDATTKQEAIRKIKNAKLQLISPTSEEEWNFNPRASYSPDTPLANIQKLLKLHIDKEIKELAGPININRWRVGPLTVNAFYNDAYNQLVFPVGMLQYPFYDPNEPEAINLGGIGSVIGHELGHAIDNHGSDFDANGALIQWMSPKDKKIFNKKTRFLIKQFNEIGHNGELTLPENISDLVGLSVAYKAAFPNHNGDNNELKRKFFLQFARKFCEVQREEHAKLRIKTNTHSLGQAIVNEQLKHQPGFKEVYNCKPSDPMVIPEEQIVKVW